MELYNKFASTQLQHSHKELNQMIWTDFKKKSLRSVNFSRNHKLL